jgi:hypothetical protein
MALGSCSTAASCSRLVDENGLASSTGGRRRASTWQLQLSHWACRVTYDAAQPTTSVDPVGIRFCAEDLTGCPPLPPFPPPPVAGPGEKRRTSRWQVRALDEFDSAVRVARRDGVTYRRRTDDRTGWHTARGAPPIGRPDYGPGGEPEISSKKISSLLSPLVGVE